MEEIKWMIVSKDRKVIAKGVPRNRWLVSVEEKTNDRILLYSSELRAKKAFTDDWFFTNKASEHLKVEDLVAVKVQITYKEVYDTIQLSKPMNSYWEGSEEEFEKLDKIIKKNRKK